MVSPHPHDMMDRGGTARRSERPKRPERRAVPRLDLPLSGRWAADGRWVHVLVESISHRGAGLSLRVALGDGTRGTLSLDEFGPPIPCEVRWTGDGRAGVAFDLGAGDADRLRRHLARHAGKGGLPTALLPDAAGLP
ncbi:PilZ domain-containing protein [Roseospira goensis]|uniref:PilZ domain-containing protein n=1 Tax=Roseospira goensis TaxID=391922 RepID=A0A7W6WL85_9PROT|nr:PilZ domain-containing protein [Roseospira goensis]MBB4286142.1 hypothetical protein [Roseospira goensis]